MAKPIYKPVEDIPVENSKNIQQGWQCPVCGRILAPFVTECPCEGRGNIYTTTNDTTYIPKNNIKFT